MGQAAEPAQDIVFLMGTNRQDVGHLAYPCVFWRGGDRVGSVRQRDRVDSAAGGALADERLIEFAPRGIVDVLDARLG